MSKVCSPTEAMRYNPDLVFALYNEALMMKKKSTSVLILSVVLAQLLTGSVSGQAQQARFTKTALLSDREVAALGAEISGVIAKDTVIELARSHRVQASSGYSRAA